MKKKRYAGEQQIMIAHSHNHDEGMDCRRILKLNTKQLRKLGEELELRIPKGSRKQRIGEQIISFCISNSSDWKQRAKARKYLGDKKQSKTFFDQG